MAGGQINDGDLGRNSAVASAKRELERGGGAMRRGGRIISGLWRPIVLVLLMLIGSGAASASPLSVVKPVMACGDLLKLDLSYVKEAPARLDSATVVTEGAPAPYCLVSGYVAPGVAFQVRLPTETWTQRMVMNGCGGYCGDLLSLPVGAPSASTGCAVAGSGELVVASHVGGHVGATEQRHSCARSPTAPGRMAIRRRSWTSSTGRTARRLSR